MNNTMKHSPTCLSRDNILGRHGCDCAITIPLDALYELVNAMSGFASNATQCGACQMSNNIARNALKRFEEKTGVTADDAYYGRAR